MIQGKNIDKQLFKAFNRTVFDLSASAAYEMVLINPDKSIYINNIYVCWEETGSSDAGVAINIGKTSSGTEYFTTTSTISKTAGDVEMYDEGDMTLALVPAGTPIYISHGGSKAGAGEVYVSFSYTIL